MYVDIAVENIDQLGKQILLYVKNRLPLNVDIAVENIEHLAPWKVDIIYALNVNIIIENKHHLGKQILHTLCKKKDRPLNVDIDVRKTLDQILL